MTPRTWIVSVVLVGVGMFAGCATAPGDVDAESSKEARGVSTNTDAVEEFNAAVEAYKSDEADLGEVESRLRKAVNIDPNFGKAWFNLGVVLEKQGRLGKAESAYQKSRKAAPKLGDPLVNLGMLAMRRGNTDEAYEYFEKAIEAESFDTTAHNNLSVRYRQQQQWEKAVSHARQALAGDSQNVGAYANLARTYYQMEAYDPARLVLLNALELTKEKGSQAHRDDLHNIFGLVELAQNDVSSAISEFSKSLENNGDFVPARMNLGAVMLNVRDFEAASKHFTKVLDLQPEHTEARISLAVAERSMGNLNEARAIYREILDDHPEHPMVHYNLAVLEHEHLARKASQGAGETAPEGAVAQMDWTIGNLQESVDHYDKAIDFYRNFLNYAGEEMAEQRQEAKNRIDEVTKLRQATREQIPELKKQKTQLQQSDGSSGSEAGGSASSDESTSQK